ncbi:MAG: tetratricopeptide repeat protein [Reyranella sp.]
MGNRRGWRNLGTGVGTALLLFGAASVPAREVAQETALAPPPQLCVDRSEIPPESRIVACTLTIDAKTLIGSDLAAAHLIRGQAYRAVGDQVRASADYRTAIALLNESSRIAPLKSSQFLQRGIAHHALQDIERALSDYDEAIRLDTGNALAHVDRGVLLATRKADMRRAIAAFDQALALVPDNAETLILRANAYTSVGEHGRALADLDRAAALASDNPRAFMVRGLVHARLGDMPRAFADYTMALSIDPGYVDALVNRGAIYSMQGSTAKALADLDQAVELQPTHALAHYNRGYAHFARRDYEQAITDYTRAIEADDRMSWAFNNRCLTRTIVDRDLAEAVSDCDEALRLQPDNVEFRETRGFVFLKLGETEIALREYDAALRVDPDRPVALYGRGLARIAKGDVRDGESDKAAARALLPDVQRQFAPYGLQ